jgi:tRNA(fMet)-specific endonuclease VapC
MRYMLDTNTCIALIRERSPQILRRLKRQAAGDVGISTITLAELRFGVAKSSRREKNAQALEEFLLPLEIVAFDEAAALAYGAVRADLERRGTKIGANDTLIGGHAMSLAVTLVTNNTKEFSRIRGLKIVDWTT